MPVQSISLRDYEYSYATAVGMALKNTADRFEKWVVQRPKGPTGNLIKAIIEVALKIFARITIRLPLKCLGYLGKALCPLEKTKIDPKGLPLAPPAIILPSNIKLDVGNRIDALYTRFDKLFPHTKKKITPPVGWWNWLWGKAGSVDEITHAGRYFQKLSFKRMFNQLISHDPSIFPKHPSSRREFCGQTSMFLKGILNKIESGELTEEREKVILNELALGSKACYPTWLQVSSKIYTELYGKQETAAIKLLRMVQEYKEDLILEFTQKQYKAQWHMLSLLRETQGKELGLNMHVNKDAYSGSTHYSQESIEHLKKGFLELYQDVNRLVAAVLTKIEAQPYDSAYFDFMVEAVTKLGAKEPINFVRQHFYREDPKDEYNLLLKPEGVHFMLRAVGILS